MAAVLAGVCLAVPAQALADNTQTSMLQDDNQIIYSTPAHEVAILQKLHALGVDIVKVSVVWYLIAPNPTSSTPPKFDAANPAAYPPGSWNRWDLLDREAHKLGMKVYFQITPLDPKWAKAPGNPPEGKALGRAPDLALFSQFVKAVGTRYSGHYGKPALPRVSMWGIWNEPNWPNWLNPWQRKVHGITEHSQPPIYRGIVNTAYRSLKATGHGKDAILIGESSNAGTIQPMTFLEDLYCVGSKFKPLKGKGAAEVGCPTKPNRSKFFKGNPGLFKMTGWAHHPYGRPDNARQGWITVYNLSTMERGLNDIFHTYGHRRSKGIPLYLTEWDGALHTNPPDKYYSTTLKQQAVWTDQGEYITWHTPYVKTLCQFLLVDDKPDTSAKKGSRKYWNTPTGGLYFYPGTKAKPALQAFRIPIWLPTANTGTHVTVWGQLRPANHHKVQRGKIEFQRQGSHKWVVLRKVSTTNPEGFILTHVAVGRPGKVRLGWQASSHHTDYSRSVTVS
jgi:hypothetical protein